MGEMSTLKEIAALKANKQPGMVDTLTEDAPILDDVKWVAASHGGWNAAEVTSAIEGPGFVEGSAPFPIMSMDTDIVQTPVAFMAGEIEVSMTKAAVMGGPAKYFADRQPKLLRQAGMDTESKLYYNYWLKACIAKGNVIDMGGTAATSGKTGLSSIIITRYDEDSNVGIYNPDQFEQARLLKITPISGGAPYHLRTQEGVTGYGVTYLGQFGWQLLDVSRTVMAIVNINSTKIPDMLAVGEALEEVRASAANTRIICNPYTAMMTFGTMKKDSLQTSNSEVNISPTITHFGDIRIIKSHNVVNANESQV